MENNIKFITAKTKAADPLARAYWTAYYNVAGTGYGPYKVPKFCKAPMDLGVAAIHLAIKTELQGSGVTFVDLDPVLGTRDALLQDQYTTDSIFQKSGWPHPNRKGASRIGEVVSRA
jgi:hypothetical protein